MPDYYFPLKERKEIAEETMAFTLDTSGSNFPFIAGQYADFTLEKPPFNDIKGKTRPFSIASSPLEKGSIMFATRMRDSAFKNSLKQISLGTKISVSSARGSFVLHDDAKQSAVFLAGGIGITPIRSIIETAGLEKKPHKLFLFYSNRTPSATAVLHDFEKFAKQNQNFKFFPTITQLEGVKDWKYPTGRIKFKMIEENVPELKNAIFYISGPNAMVSAMRQVLAVGKIKSGNIVTEEFSGY